MMKPAAVTEREAAYLEHRRRAAAQQLPLSEYCRRNGLRVGEWYQVQRGLSRKGTTNRTGSEKAPATRFVPVRVTGGAVVSATVMAMGCRIGHPSGWMIECASLPPASWLNGVVRGCG
ncbi:MAG: hypothetical protein WDM77_18530 [Steroidobacteraceae bacterium]